MKPLSPDTKRFLIVFGAIVAFSLLFLCAAIVGISHSGESLDKPATLQEPGGLDPIPVATSASALSDFTALASAGNNAGKEELVAAGKIFRVRAGTRVTVLSAGMTSCRFRIDDSEHAGETGYTYAEWVR
jgi:hypothetical protein